MNAKNIKKALHAKLDDWLQHIDDPKVTAAIKRDTIVTGGAIVSMLLNEPVNDYDIYFKTVESCRVVVEYYATLWNKTHPDKPQVKFYDYSLDKYSGIDRPMDRVQLVIGHGRGNGVVLEPEESGIDDNTEPYTTENEDNPIQPHPEITKPRYRPRYFSTNALSLSDKIQLVIRFTGPVEEIHKNFDFEHTKCCYDYFENELTLPTRALECIINKELIYSGSRYPLTSIIRTRKFITRGWTINAGQYVKMAFELNELDLKDINVFKDQVVGVDSAYFNQALDAIANKMQENPSFTLDKTYLFEVINRIF